MHVAPDVDVRLRLRRQYEIPENQCPWAHRSDGSRCDCDRLARGVHVDQRVHNTAKTVVRALVHAWGDLVPQALAN